MRRFATIACLALLSSGTLRAQTIAGVLLTAERNPVLDARLFLVTPRGFAADTARTNEHGEFLLHAGAPGRYALSIRRLGYAPERTPYFTLVAGQDKKDTIIVAFTRLLRPVEVVVRDEVKRTTGLDVRSLGKRFLSPEFVDSVRVSATKVGDFIRRAAIPGVWILDDGNQPVCYKVQVQSGCAEIFVDGLSVTGTDIELSPLDIESIVLLRPNEGFIINGSPSGSVNIYTRKTITRANR
ncbi:MAG: carboxypeptidase-like regulatory domain-containing protein [Gemmatimonadaceae bacterium]